MDITKENNHTANNSTSLSEDITRDEMRWNEKIEDLFVKYQAESKELSDLHALQGKKKKKYHYMLSIPSVLIPIVMSSTTSYFGNNHDYSVLANSLGYLFITALTGLNTFLGYGQKYTKHEEACTRYDELYREIESILIKNKKYRLPADVSLEHVLNKFIFLNMSSISV
jgi:hypothetical protein